MAPIDSSSASKADPSFFVPIALCTLLGCYLIHCNPTSMSVRDLSFAIGYPVYILLANTFCFQSALATKMSEPLSLGKGQFLGMPAFTVYMVIFQLFTVLAPLLYIGLSSNAGLDGRSAVSPLVLLLAQVATENSTNWFHDVLRVLVPIGFNAFRLLSLHEWSMDALEQYQGDPSSGSLFGCILAFLNLAMWIYNLFFFLLLRVLPVYFDRKDTPHIEMAYTMFPIPKHKVR